MTNENEIHEYFKANLFHEGDTFIKGDKKYLVLQVELDNLFVNEFETTKSYKPDITLKVENKRTGKISTICIELYCKNAKNKQDYIDRWAFFYEKPKEDKANLEGFEAIFEIDLNQLELNSNCNQAMNTAKTLFSTKVYKDFIKNN